MKIFLKISCPRTVFRLFKGFAPAAGPLTCKNPHICETVSRELQVLTVSDEISCELFLVNVKRLVLLGGILFVLLQQRICLSKRAGS